MADQGHLNKLNEGASAWNQWRKKHPQILPDLRKADLHGAALAGIDFRRTNLDGANLCQTDLSGATLRHASLHRTYFKETVLRRTNLHNASLLDTMFLNVDLSETINLETVFHLGPSTICLDTIQRSRGNIPEVFLRGAGVSEQLLACIYSSGLAPFDYCTCFISYSSRDQHFVDILYQDLHKEGVLCWYAPESLKAGEKFPASIVEAVQSREKLLVVLSKSSLSSEWVEREVTLARQNEGKGKREVLVPICLDSAVLNSTIDWAAALRKRRNIRSFQNWQQPSCYQKMLKNLLYDLRRE